VSTASQSPSASSSLLFFDSQLRVRWNAGAEVAIATDADRSRRIAGELLSIGSDASWPRSSVAVRQPGERLRRASLLTARVLRLEASASLDAATELWLDADAEWHWAARAKSAHSFFVGRARALGAEDPERVATNIAQAISEELVPLFHLRGMLLAEPGNVAQTTMHRTALAEWTLSETAGDELVTLFGWWLLLLARDAADPTAATDASIVSLVRARTIDDPLVADIVAYYARLHLSLVRPRMEKKVGIRWFKERLDALEQLEQEGDSTIVLFESISTMALALGLREIDNKAKIADGVYHVARALVFDPANGTARERYREAIATSERLQKESRAISARGQRLAPEGHLLVNGFADGVAHAKTLFDSDEAKRIATSLERAAQHGLARRLGIPVNDATARAQVTTLARAVDQVGSWAASQKQTPISPTDYPLIVRSAAVSADRTLQDFPWERLNPALERGVLPNSDYLALFIAEPELPEVNTFAATIHETAAASPPAPDRPRHDWAATWFLSTRNPWSKLAYAAGVVMLVYGIGARTTNTVREAMLGRSYDRVVTAIRSHNDSSVADAGLAFLDRRRGTWDDPRVDQVSGWVDVAVARRVLALAGAERTDAAKQLLARYEDTRAAIIVKADGGTQ